MTLLSEVEAALPDEFMTHRAIWQGMGVWAPNSVRNTLNKLVNLGKAERIKHILPESFIGFVYLYRRARLPMQRAA